MADMQHRTSFFTGESVAKQQRVFVVHGMGGIGKSQLRAEYVRIYRDRFSAVFWLDGSSKDALRQSMADAALRLPPHAGNLIEVVGHARTDALCERFLQWLSIEGNTNWLLIIDNVDREWQSDVDACKFQIQMFNVKREPLVSQGNHRNFRNLQIHESRLCRLGRITERMHGIQSSSCLIGVVDTDGTKVFASITPFVRSIAEWGPFNVVDRTGIFVVIGRQLPSIGQAGHQLHFRGIALAAVVRRLETRADVVRIKVFDGVDAR